jgi:hypothetical protein
MNPLETLKERLKIKPAVQSSEGIRVVIGTTDVTEGVKPKTKITEERDNGQRAKEILERMKQRKLTHVVAKLPTPVEDVKQMESKAPVVEEEIVSVIRKKPRKAKVSLVLEEEPIVEENVPEGGPQLEAVAVALSERERRGYEEPGPPVEEEEIEVLTVKPRKRTTPKVVRGVIPLGPDSMIQIGDTPLPKRLPPIPKYDLKASTYYMNNRELFVNFINGVFQPYREDLLDESKDITCEDIGKEAGSIGLLTHQKIVRDYINIYTPYRGLLLYHGLGSGKTCSSIAIAEGLKSFKKIIIMTPASLRRNYLEEIKKCGDLIYRKNQYWEWVSIDGNPQYSEALSSVLGLSFEFIRRKKGAWLTNVTKPNNYAELSTSDKKNLNEQLDEMIQNKYTFINYNNPRLREKFKQLTNNFTTNLFDGAVVIVDEAHNLISRMVNKISKSKNFSTRTKGTGILPTEISLQIYEFLLRAEDCRVVLLTGTPIINYPNEIGILFNILRGYIKTWNFPLVFETTKKMNKETFQEIFAREKIIDFIDYSPGSKLLTITRNPFGFENKVTSTGYKGVKKTEEADIRGMTTDEDFIKRVVNILKKNDISVPEKGVSFVANTALPDTLEEFINNFVDKDTGIVSNIEKFKRRIIGLTSYFRSAQEELLPKYDKNFDFHVVNIPMSNYQFKQYEIYRHDEREREKPLGPSLDANGMERESSSTYKIFSRLACNFVMPKPPGRPIPKSFRAQKQEEQKQGQGQEQEAIGGANENDEKEMNINENVEENVDVEDPQYEDENPEEKKIAPGKKSDAVGTLEVIETVKSKNLMFPNDEFEEEIQIDEMEGDEVIGISDADYKKAITQTMVYLKQYKNKYLIPDELKIYSPKFLAMLENIEDPEHRGLHLIYSQFRSMEGIGIFCLVLEANGFAQFKIRRTSSDSWELAMSEEDLGKPTYALYTGTEDATEREIIRNIYNGAWDNIPNNIATQLRAKSTNNNMGEIVKVLMITSAGSEGINLKNTRYVHIMDPYWHPVRIEQVIGRARRICSHQSLPIELQTVEVFIYLMTLTKEQLASDDATELRLKDKSKMPPGRPVTTDELLFEISSIKERLSSQLLKGVKESSIDCATHIKSSSKEGLQCLSFAQPRVNDFSYNPNYAQDETDTVAAMNRVTVDWEAVEFTYKKTGKKYMLRKDTYQVYDYDSVIQAKQVTGVNPILIGKLVKREAGWEIVKER